MAYQPQQQRLGGSDRVWLASLLRTYERTTREVETPRAATIAGLKAQLARPQASLAKPVRFH